jgi:hypothetical protein
LSFCLSETLLSSTAKIAVALLCPFSYAHWTTSHLNFPIYDSPLDCWHPCSLTMIYNTFEDPPLTFQQLRHELILMRFCMLVEKGLRVSVASYC